MRCVCRVGEFGAVAARFVHPRGLALRGRSRSGGYAPRAERGRGLKAATGRKRAGARLHAQTHSAHTGAGYAVARAGAVIISGRETKKKGLFAEKNTKNAPRRIRTRARAFIRVFCLPYGRAGAYIAGIMATRAKKTAPKAAAKSATAAELVPVKRRRGAPLGNRNAAGHGAPRGNKNGLGNHRSGRPRAGGAGAEAYSVKINLAITPTQRAKLDDAAEKAGIKFADFLRKLINEF